MVTDTKEEQRRGPFGRGHHRPDVPDSPLGKRVREWILKHSVEHLHGPKEVDYEIDELVVLVLLRNGRPYIKPFVEHYFSLGAKHLVFLDNGSTDGTVETLKNYEKNVTVLRTGLPFKRYNLAMKRYLIERFGRGRWTLSVDIDELFDYPYSDVVSLKALLGYLNENSYTAVVSYMLDMFPERLSEDNPLTEDVPLKKLHRFYDISDIRTRSYNDIGDLGNVLSNEEIKLLNRGVQWRLFGLHPLLTKHPLVFLDDKLRPMDLSEHWVGNARIADFTGILLHYKISGNLYGLARQEIEERRYINQGGKYDKYFRILEKAPSLLIKNDTSRELKSVNELVGSWLVTVSRQYMRFVESKERGQGDHSEESWSERLYEAFFNARAEVATLVEKLERTRQQKIALEKQIQAIQSSRRWKVLTALSHVKTGATSILGRLKNRR